MGNHAERHDWPRSCRDVLSKKCYGIHKTGQNKKRRHKTRTRDLWNTRRETEIQTKLDQLTRKNGQHQTAGTRPELQTPGKKGSRTPQETMATRRCRNRSNDLIHGGRLLLLLLKVPPSLASWSALPQLQTSKYVAKFLTWCLKQNTYVISHIIWLLS